MNVTARLVSIFRRSAPGGEPRNMGRGALYCTIVVTGAEVLMIEIIGTRLISPYFGVSLYVWSSLITVTLLSLAAGYWVGGKVAEALPDAVHVFDLLLGAAAANAAIPLVSSLVLGFCGTLGLRPGSFSAAAILFAPPLFLLGMVTPYAVKIAARPGSPVAVLTGRLYALSTFGSVAGALGAGFFLVPLLAVDRALFLLSAVLAAVAVVPFVAWRLPVRAIIAILLAVVSLFLLLRPSVLPGTDRMQVVAQKESFYGHVRVIDSASTRSLLLNGIVQGSVDRSGMPVDRYFYFIDRLVAAYRPAAREFLVVGLGAGSFHRLRRGRATRIDTVEIDPAVCDIARSHFGYREDGGSLFVEDGRYYISRARMEYDVIFIDAYAAEALSTHLFTVESFRAMERILGRAGIVVINFHDFRDAPRNIASCSIVRTLRAAFRDVLAFEVQPWHDTAIANVVFLASNAALDSTADTAVSMQLPLPLSIDYANGALLSDVYNPLDTIYNPISEAMRNATLRAFTPNLLLFP